MFPLRYLQLDVFPASTGGGNPLGVVFGAAHWNSAQMQQFAAWTQLVETTFVLPPRIAEASYRLRIFTPYKEIPFAGHPSIGSAHAVLKTGWTRARQGLLQQECGAGVLPIRVTGDAASRDLLLCTPPARILCEGDTASTGLASVLADMPLGRLGGMLADGGRRWWLAEFADEDRLRSWQPDHAAMTELAHASQSMGLCAFARSRNPDYELVVRAFPAGAGIVEDPASGAANGLIAACIALREPDGPLARGYRVSQGREIGHDARLILHVDENGNTWVGGQSRIVIDGQLHWSSEACPVHAVQPARVAVG
ncbi:MAG TPA: PhzF family phenazine biosynthesis protein [Oleiagrimonas sp.]|nr:PhzF family phenazine biosynthesis protein [Oleiagrimonas sp.]